MCMMVAIVACLGACSPEHTSHSDQRSVPKSGWLAETPIYFYPEYGDSTLTYDVILTIRYTTGYQFKNLNLVVDFVSDKHKVMRRRINFVMADDFGNWQGSGFGSIYQLSTVVISGIKPQDLHSVVVWPAMEGCKRVQGLSDIGIIVSPSK